jgi:hypothetical protein
MSAARLKGNIHKAQTDRRKNVTAYGVVQPAAEEPEYINRMAHDGRAARWRRVTYQEGQ